MERWRRQDRLRIWLVNVLMKISEWADKLSMDIGGIAWLRCDRRRGKRSSGCLVIAMIAFLSRASHALPNRNQ